jgi:hypothetical protein
MATERVKDLVVKTGTYQQNGETKNRYKNVGAVLDAGNGEFIVLDRTFNPAGCGEGERVIIDMFDVRDEQ